MITRSNRKKEMEKRKDERREEKRTQSYRTLPFTAALRNIINYLFY